MDLVEAWRDAEQGRNRPASTDLLYCCKIWFDVGFRTVTRGILFWRDPYTGDGYEKKRGGKKEKGCVEVVGVKSVVAVRSGWRL